MVYWLLLSEVTLSNVPQAAPTQRIFSHRGGYIGPHTSTYDYIPDDTNDRP